MKIATFIFGFFFSTVTIAQVDVLCMSLIDPSLKIFYSGLENEVKIIGIKIDSTINLVSKTGVVHHFASKNRSEYTVKYKRAKIDTLSIFRGGEMIFKDRFEIKTLPNPVLRIGNIVDNSATVEDILSHPEIRIDLGDFLWNKKYAFKKFDLLIIDNSGNISDRFNDEIGNKFSKDQIKSIKNMKSGYTLIVKDVFIYFPESEGRSMRPLSITIK